MEDQLRQAQRIESIGRLAGGVAHDFNNKLTIINGFAELAMETIDPKKEIRDFLFELFLPPRALAREPDWACPQFTALSSRTKAL